MSSDNHGNQNSNSSMSNVYAFPKREKISQAPSENPNKKLIGSSKILKSGEFKTGEIKKEPLPMVHVNSYMANELSGMRVSRPGVLPPVTRPNLALENLKENFKTLNELQAKLRFMLEELEQFVQD